MVKDVINSETHSVANCTSQQNEPEEDGSSLDKQCSDMFNNLLNHLVTHVFYNSLKQFYLERETLGNLFEVPDELEGNGLFHEVSSEEIDECICPNCMVTVDARKFVPHLQECMDETSSNNGEPLTVRADGEMKRVTEEAVDDLPDEWNENFKIEDSKDDHSKKDLDWTNSSSAGQDEVIVPTQTTGPADFNSVDRSVHHNQEEESTGEAIAFSLPPI